MGVDRTVFSIARREVTVSFLIMSATSGPWLPPADTVPRIEAWAEARNGSRAMAVAAESAVMFPLLGNLARSNAACNSASSSFRSPFDVGQTNPGCD